MKIKYKISVILCTLVLTACSDLLDIPKDGRIPFEDIFKDRDKTRGYLNSCFDDLSYIQPYFDITSYSDESQNAETVRPGYPYSSWYGGQATASWFPVPSSNAWAGLYEGIRKCNVFLANINDAEITATEAEIVNWKAQALSLRALYYFQLIKRYGGVPLVLDEIPIGSDMSGYVKSSFNECVTSILNDCDSALSAPTSAFPYYNGSRTVGMMTKAVCHSIKSEAILYAVSPQWNDGTYTWDDALLITKSAVDSLNKNYALYSRTPATNVAQNSYALYHITSPDVARQDKETILLLGSKLQIWKYAGMPDTDDMISSGPNPTQDLVDAYEMDNGEAPILGYEDDDKLIPIINPASGYDPLNPYVDRDPRFGASIYFNGADRNLPSDNVKVETFVGGTAGLDLTNFTHTCTGYYVRKFNRWNSSRDNDADGYIRLFRYAELYLNFAEAAANAIGPETQYNGMSAKDAVDVVRQRSGMPAFPTGLSKDDFLKKYRNERRIELAFEGHRYFDVRRWRILNETDKFVTGMKITKDENGDLTYVRFRFPNRNTISDKYYLFPIDQAEVNKILSITGDDWQNPGW